MQLNVARSQSSCCLFEDSIVFVFGGYNKEVGTLNSIERVDLQASKRRISLLEIKLPLPLRRCASIKISNSKLLILGGITRLSKDSDAVYCFDIEGETNYSIEPLDKIDRCGAIDLPVIIDSIGSLHLFVENASGTSPPFRTVYSFLEYS